MRRQCALLVGLALIAVVSRAEAGPAALLRAAARPDALAGDLAAWKSIPYRARIPALLDALSGDDETLALFATENLDVLDLTLAEQRRAGRLVSSHPERWFGPKGDPARLPVDKLGVIEVPLFWKAVVEKGLDFTPGVGLVTHRQVVPEHLPRLVVLLPRAKPKTFRWLAQILTRGADGIDRHREDVARGLLYTLARLGEERGGAKAPALDDIRIDAPTRGLPKAFRTLAGVAWGLDPRRLELERNGKRDHSPLAWIQRWSFELTPGPDDLAWLADAAARATDPRGRVAAVRLLGKLASADALVVLERLAGATDQAAVFAAAELSRRGRPKRFESMSRPGSADIDADFLGDAWYLACEVRPDLVPHDIESLSDLHEWAEYEESWGVRRPVALIETIIRDALADETADPLTVLPLLVQLPDLLTRDVEDRIIERLGSWRPRPDGFFDDEDEAEDQDGAILLDEIPRAQGVDLFLGLLETRRPDGLRTLIAAWSKGKSRGARSLATTLEYRLDLDKQLGVPVLPGQQVDAGLLNRLMQGEWLMEGEEPEEPWITHNRLCGEGRPLDAALHVISSDPRKYADSLGYLALTPTKDVLRLLRDLRAARRPYWPATLALAIAGDADARAESLGMIRDGRTLMFDRLNEPLGLTCAADPEFISHWVDRIEAICCQAWPSFCVLEGAFPALEIHGIVRAHMATQRRAREMLCGAGVRFRRSHILDAWVPVR
jgi:hypothetical protein